MAHDLKAQNIVLSPTMMNNILNKQLEKAEKIMASPTMINNILKKQFESVDAMCEARLKCLSEEVIMRLRVPSTKVDLFKSWMFYTWNCTRALLDLQIEPMSTMETFPFAVAHEALARFRESTLAPDFESKLRTTDILESQEGQQNKKIYEFAIQRRKEEIVRSMVKRALSRAVIQQAPRRVSEKSIATLQVDAAKESTFYVAVAEARDYDARRKSLVEQHKERVR